MPGLPGLLALQQQALNQQHHHHHAQLNGVAQDLSLPKDRKDTGKLHNGGGNELLMEGGDNKMETVADVLRHAGSAFSLVRPKTEPGTRKEERRISYILCKNFAMALTNVAFLHYLQEVYHFMAWLY